MQQPARAEQRVAVITGGARGLGRASAFMLADKGVSICVNYTAGRDTAALGMGRCAERQDCRNDENRPTKNQTHPRHLPHGLPAVLQDRVFINRPYGLRYPFVPSECREFGPVSAGPRT